MKKVILVLILAILSLNVFAEPEWLIDPYSKGGKKGGTLYIPTTAGPKTFNYAWAQETSSSNIIGLFLDGLIQNDNKGLPTEPLLAKSFSKKETASGGTEYTFTLRKGLVWSDKKVLDIDDVIFSFKEIYFKDKMTANGNETYRDDKKMLPEIIKVDEYTVKFLYKGKNRRGFFSLGGAPILPKHLFEKVCDSSDTLAKYWTVEQVDKLIASGPFKVKEYKQGVRVVLEKNPDYYIKSPEGIELPYLDQIIFQIVTDTNTMRLKFEAGEVDILNPTASDFPSLKALSATKKWKSIIGPSTLGSTYFEFNYNAENPNNRMLFRELNFRKAIACSINREAYIQNVQNGLGLPIYSCVAPSSPYFNKAVERYGENEYRYSITKAKEYLSKINGGVFKDGKFYYQGKPVSITIQSQSGSQPAEEMCNLVVDSLKKLGIDATFRPMQFNALIAARDAGKVEVFYGALTGSIDPASGTNVWPTTGGLHAFNFSPENKTWVKERNYRVTDFEKRIDEIFVEQVGVLDEKRLGDLFDEFQMIVAKNQPVVYTIMAKYLLIYKDTLHLANPSPSPAAGNGLNAAIWHPWSVWKE